MSRVRRRWSTVSLHGPYIETKLPELKRRHKRSFTTIVEILIDRALADPSLLATPLEVPRDTAPSDEPDAGDGDHAQS